MAPKKRDRSKSNRIMAPKKSERDRSKRNRIKRERRAAIKNNEAELTPGEIKTLEKNRERSAVYNEEQRRKREIEKKRAQKRRNALNKKKRFPSSEETLVSNEEAAAGDVAARERKIALSLRSCNDKTHPSTIELTRCLDSLCILQNQDPTVNPIFLDDLVVHVAVVTMMIFGRMISEDALTESSVP